MLELVYSVINLVFYAVYVILTLNILSYFFIYWKKMKKGGFLDKAIKKASEPILKPFRGFAKDISFRSPIIFFDLSIIFAYIFFALTHFLISTIFLLLV